MKCRGHCVKKGEASTWKRILPENKGEGCQGGFVFFFLGGIVSFFSNSEKINLA